MSLGATTVGPLRYCTQCGKPLLLAAQFCTACGASVGIARVQAAIPLAAHDLFIEALRLTLAEDSAVPAMPLMQKALAIGLMPSDEVEARMVLADGYRQIAGTSGLPEHKMVETVEFQQCIVQIERAFELDRAGSLGFFSKPLNIGRLTSLDTMYTMASHAKEELEGTAAAIAYLAAKLGAVSYLKRPPLLVSLLRLADLYRTRGAFEDAAQCLRKILNTAPLYPADQELNDKLRAAARQMLNDGLG
jgi:tetratricopeptide (TPR) repeat protein